MALDPDPRTRLAHVSYYAGGFRVLKYGPLGLRQVGAFIDERGNNFWGVEVHRIKGTQYVLASDRDFGLYIFRPWLQALRNDGGGDRAPAVVTRQRGRNRPGRRLIRPSIGLESDVDYWDRELFTRTPTSTSEGRRFASWVREETPSLR